MLRVPPFRGDQVAAGVVVLGVLVLLLEVRMGWPAGGQLALAAGATAGVGFLLAGCPREPRPYVSAIVVTTLVLFAVTLGRVGEVLGASGVLGGTGGVAWKLAVLGVVGAGLARTFDAAGATLVAALSLAFLPLAFFTWAVDLSGGAQRLLLLVMAIVLALFAVSRRDRRPTHAAQLANAGGLALASIAALPLAGGAFGAVVGEAVSDRLLPVLCSLAGGEAASFVPTIGTPSVSCFIDGRIAWGWGVPLLIGGFGLLAYGAVDRQRGPVLVGLVVLAGFVASASSAAAGSLLGWPMLLAAAAAFMLVVGLRPTTPAPPEPRAPEEPGPPLPLSGPRRTDPR